MNHGITADDYRSAYIAETRGKTYSHNGINYNTASRFSNGYSVDRNAEDQFAWSQKYANPTTSPTEVIVLVLGENEPPSNPSWNVSGSTTAKKGNAKSTNNEPVYDVVNVKRTSVKNPGKQKLEPINMQAKITLHYAGGKAPPASRDKTFTLHEGNNNSPKFTPADFGWHDGAAGIPHGGWQPGDYWFEAHIGKASTQQKSEVTTTAHDLLERSE